MNWAYENTRLTHTVPVAPAKTPPKGRWLTKKEAAALLPEGSIPFTRSKSSHFVFHRNLARPPALFLLSGEGVARVGGWLWLVLDVVGAVVLAAALIYGMANWRRRPKSPSG